MERNWKVAHHINFIFLFLITLRRKCGIFHLIDEIEVIKMLKNAYFEFKKAFDCVPHLRLLHNLNELGVCCRLHSWIQSFLTIRTLRVKVGEQYFKCIDLTSGGPQGSVLGPVLFFLFINDCLNGLSCDAIMFADDVKIWRTIESPPGVQSLQNNIEYLSSWSQEALLSLNTD